MADNLSPTFIVGIPRSGTTLLSTLLSSHSLISCGAETHFFPYLEANYQQLSSVLQDRHWPDKATDFVTDLKVETYRVHDLFSVDVQGVYDFLVKRRPSLQALLESLTVQQMLATQKQRWVEKSPNHILHLAMMRRLYPAAKIVRIVRDPRDSALSMASKLPWASDFALDNAYLIQDWHRKSRYFFEQDNLTYTLKYENLVTQPEKSLQAVCDFVQVSFEPSMLETRGAAQHTAPEHEPWKIQVGQRLDPSRCYAWQKLEPGVELEAIGLCCQDLIQGFGYPQIESALTPIFSHYTSYRFIQSLRSESAEKSAISKLLEHNHLLVPRRPSTMAAGEEITFCDVPISGKNYRKSFKKFIRFCLGLFRLRLKEVNIKFTDFCQSPQASRNIFGEIAAFMLRALGSKEEIVEKAKQ
jgi:hypothetical protein